MLRPRLAIFALVASVCASGFVIAEASAGQSMKPKKRQHAIHRTSHAAPAKTTMPKPVPAPDPHPFSTALPPPEPHGPLMVKGSDGKEHVCLEQRAQDFLIRSNWFTHGIDGAAMFQKSLRYRTEHYGYFAGFGLAEWNATTPKQNAVAATFMGMPIQINKRVVPALACVEKALMAGTAHNDYQPRGIGGIRFHNTYHGGEVSNHVYGIAMDMDSDVNTCCGCVGAWPSHPLCQKQVSSIYERARVPASWVEVFERYGWYWLGHDVLQDTMHFEFLGDPDKILAP
jgi:hypothetical protein